MFGGNRIQLVDPQGIKLKQVDLTLQPVNFIHHIKNRLGSSAKKFDNIPVVWGNTGFSIQNHDNDRGMLNGLHDLTANQRGKFVAVTGEITAGIHNRKWDIFPDSFAVMAVSRNTGSIVHQGVLGPGDAVEQGGFSNIGPADKGDYGFHRVSN